MNRVWEILSISLIIVIAVVCGINIHINGCDKFFQTDFLGAADLILTLFITVIIVNSQTKRTKLKENFERIVSKFQNNFLDVSFLFDKNSEKQTQKILILKRKTSNQFGIIKKYAKKLRIKKDYIEKIEEKLKEYHEFTTDHMNNLENVIIDCNRLSEIIDNLCEEMKLILYD